MLSAYGMPSANDHHLGVCEVRTALAPSVYASREKGTERWLYSWSTVVDVCSKERVH
jgi:hypothetical protein